MRLPPITLAAIMAPALLAACSPWQRARDYDGWTLYVRDEAQLPIEEFQAVIEPALVAVEERMGPFDEKVRVHAWIGAVEMKSGNQGEIREGGEGARQDVPGIGPARVRAFHTRSSGWLSATGVFVGVADCGTAVHELVHARLADEDAAVPLWFEEGLASVLGDGVLHAGEWFVDGFSCWPYRELREERFNDEELADLLAITPSTPHSVRDNVLVHFVGWAVVLDLVRELETYDWRVLLAHFERAPDPLAEVRVRMNRSLSSDLPLRWIEYAREQESVGARLAAVKGMWKIGSAPLLEELLEMLRHEENAEVRTGIAVNLLAAAGPAVHSSSVRARLWYEALEVIGKAEAGAPEEREALAALYRAYHDGDSRVDAQAELEKLARFWEE